MRRTIFTLILLYSAVTASLAQVRVAPFLAYGEGINLWGIGAYAEVLFNDRVSFSPQFTLYFPENFDNNPRHSGWELNANMNYYVIRGDIGYLYGLEGLNFTTIRTRISTPVEDDVDNDGNLGFNFGIGTMVRVNDYLLPFVEGKYTAGSYSQATLIFGVKFQVGSGDLDYDY